MAALENWLIERTLGFPQSTDFSSFRHRELINLEKLVVSNNQLTSLPSEIGSWLI